MSIEERLLKALCDNKVLHYWNPKLDPDESVYRRLYLRPDAYQQIERPALNAKDRNYLLDLRRYLKSFVVGESFDDDENLKNLDTEYGLPDEGIFAIRFLGRPQLRLFGGFPIDNVFVGVHVHNRGDLPRGEWVVQKEAMRKEWAGALKCLDILDGTVRQLRRIIGHSRSALVSNVRPEDDL